MFKKFIFVIMTICMITILLIIFILSKLEVTDACMYNQIISMFLLNKDNKFRWEIIGGIGFLVTLIFNLYEYKSKQYIEVVISKQYDFYKEYKEDVQDVKIAIRRFNNSLEKYEEKLFLCIAEENPTKIKMSCEYADVQRLNRDLVSCLYKLLDRNSISNEEEDLKLNIELKDYLKKLKSLEDIVRKYIPSYHLKESEYYDLEKSEYYNELELVRNSERVFYYELNNNLKEKWKAVLKVK
ncbi:hypothetical protein [Vagococcus fessus]|uniref:Uncharacterized protein n=1 Tax=Vagococcus fessus TaxID=120370 RepID=A0A430A5A8_9ENTE|nr:hypothetical protein [Vagococcus fessus]RSU01954.1 hypothetical protein CBF31_09305 [Vagococcus fessus]